MNHALFYPLNHRLPEDNSLLAGNRSFLYGDGFFESMRISNGHINFFEDHCERIHYAFEVLKLKASVKREELSNNILSLADDNNEYKCRLTFFRAGSGTYSPEHNDAGLMIQLSEVKQAAYLSNGISAIIYRENVKPVTPLSSVKTTSAAVHVLASLYAKEHHADTALITNSKGNIIEGAATNLFIYDNGMLITPPVSEGCVMGVARKNLLTVAASEGIQVQEKPLSEEEALAAEEIILTNSFSLVTNVSKINDLHFDNKIGKLLFEKMMLRAASGY